LQFILNILRAEKKKPRLWWQIDSKVDGSSSGTKSFSDKMHSSKTKYIMIINAAKLQEG
jgi:hypothetical protein